MGKRKVRLPASPWLARSCCTPTRLDVSAPSILKISMPIMSVFRIGTTAVPFCPRVYAVNRRFMISTEQMYDAKLRTSVCSNRNTAPPEAELSAECGTKDPLSFHTNTYTKA